jgi:hypothetical protein
MAAEMGHATIRDVGLDGASIGSQARRTAAMHHRSLRRAAALSLGALLLFTGTAAADTVPADANPGTTTVIEPTLHLGDVAPGGTISTDVRFIVTCFSLNHVDAGQSVSLDWTGGGTVPGDGAVVGVTPVTLAPLATPWPIDGEGCAGQTQEGGALSRVTLRAPTSPGTHTFTVMWNRTLQPPGNDDAVALSRFSAVDLSVRVVENAPPANTPPTLSVPASFTVEGDTTGGWTAAWSGVGATDAEDDPDPTASCTPSAGSVLPLGTTTVSCSVEDAAGESDADTFDVTVVDTTAPVLAGMPADRSVSTTEASGAAVTYAAPTATDVVDAAPAVACSPASGSTFPVGTTPVTCTATDASQNASSAAFDVTVELDAPAPGHSAAASWLEPVAGSGGTFVANRGRTIPVKVRLFVDDLERRTGDAGLTLTPCGGGTPGYVDLFWGGGRWNHALDTSRLAGSCYEVTATVDDHVAGAFTLDLRGGAAATATRRSHAPKPKLDTPRGHGHAKHRCAHPRRP